MPKRARASRGRETRAIENWDDVRFFLAIHRAGSLSAAAGPLRVSQPTCGRRLAALEDALGVRLFDRIPEGVRITPEGEALLDAAAMMERSAADLSVRAAATERGLQGVVRIASNELFASSFLVRALERLRERYPGLHFELVLSNREADLLRGEADVAFRFRPFGMRPTSDALVARKLGDEPHGLFAVDAYVRRRRAPRDPARLRGHDVVVFTGPHPASAWCTDAFREATVVLRSDSMQTTASAVAAGLGLGVLPFRVTRMLPQLRPLSGAIARGTAWLVLRPDLRTVPRIRVVVDELAAMFRAERVAA